MVKQEINMSETAEVAEVKGNGKATVEQAQQAQAEPVDKTATQAAQKLVKLTENELLKLKNVALQKENLEMQRQNLHLQEMLLVKEISVRANVDVNGWVLNPQHGVLVKPDPQQ